MQIKKKGIHGYRYLQDIFLEALLSSPIKKAFIGSLFFLLIGVLFNLCLPFVLKAILETFEQHQSHTLVVGVLLSYGLVWGMGQSSQHLRTFLTAKIEQRVTFFLGSKVIEHLYQLSHQYFVNQKPGAVTNVIRRAQRDVPNILLGLFFYVLPTLIEFVGVIFLIMKFYPIFYVYTMVIILLSFFLYTFLSTPFVMRLRKIANEADKEVDGAVTDWITNYETVKAFGQRNFAIQVCNAELRKREQHEVAFSQGYAWVQLGQSIVLGIGLTFMTYCVGMGVWNDQLTVGDFVLFNSYLLQFIGPISILGHVIQDIKKAIIDMKGVLDILETPSDIQEISNPLVLSGSSFSVEFDDVSFQYDKRQIISHLSFRIEEGQTVLIKGKTGMGKSTMAKLLLRLYDPTEGEILINGMNIRTVSFDSLYKTIGWVPQETYLLNDTLFNNVRFVKPEATLEEVVEALQKAQLKALIQKLPDGLDTIVGDRGIKLSGGEKQRISIARLFLKNPAICIFDESSSALDKKTDEAIQKNVEKYLPHSTKIFITHRPLLLKKVDRMIELGNI